jgi:3-hydroxybutyryl-CoA dehydrogenase
MKRIAVIGAGTMGRGIGQAVALAGYKVILYDVDEETAQSAMQAIVRSIENGVSLDKVDAGDAAAARESILPTARLETATKATLIIEAVPEDLALKKRLFHQLDALAGPEAILASNTSSLSINALAGVTSKPARVIGMHFFNPAHIMELVEVVGADDTADETVAAAVDFVHSIGKTPVYCRDTPGFIVNRVARPFYGEAFRLLGEQAAEVQTIDRVIKSLGFPMGPFELVDLIGCDVNYAVTESVYESYFHEPKYRPHPIQRKMVESGRLGRKSGRGFYDYR